MVELAYLLAAIALWRTWDTSYFRWIIAGCAVMLFLCNEAAKNAFNQAVAERNPQDEVDVLMAGQEAKTDSVFMFYMTGSLALFAVTVLLSVSGIIYSLF